jgi:hypothetical protein
MTIKRFFVTRGVETETQATLSKQDTKTRSSRKSNTLRTDRVILGLIRNICAKD